MSYARTRVVIPLMRISGSGGARSVGRAVLEHRADRPEDAGHRLVDQRSIEGVDDVRVARLAKHRRDVAQPLFDPAVGVRDDRRVELALARDEAGERRVVVRCIEAPVPADRGEQVGAPQVVLDRPIDRVTARLWRRLRRTDVPRATQLHPTAGLARAVLLLLLPVLGGHGDRAEERRPTKSHVLASRNTSANATIADDSGRPNQPIQTSLGNGSPATA